MEDLVAFLILMVVLIFIWNFLQNKNSADLPPGPWNLPILGSVLWLDSQAPYRSLAKYSKKYGPIFGLQLGKIYTVVVCDPKLLKKILLKDEGIGKPPLYIVNTLLKGKGILVTQGNLWKEQRKFVVNFLKSAGASRVSPNRKHLQAQIMESVDDFVQYVKDRGDRVVLNPSEVLVHNVASIASVLFLGKFWKRDDQFWKNLLHCLEEGAKLVGIAGPLNFLPFLRFLPQYRKTLNFLFKAYDTTYEAYYASINDTKMANEEKHNTLVKAFFNEKLKTGSMYTEEQLCSLLIDLFGASIDTTTSSLLWILLYLAKYKQVQTKIRQELNDVLQGKTPSTDDLPNLPFMQATLAEVSRIRTVIPLGIPHSALQDIQVEGFRIPKGAMIMPLLWGIHMDPKVWEDPEKFKPERFLDDNGRFHKPESFIPFQTGKRMCLGEELAKMIIFSFVSVILLNFEINSSVECEVDLNGVCSMTLTPKPQNLVFVKI